MSWQIEAWQGISILRRGHRYLSGHLTRSKNFKTPFFKRYWKFLPGGYSNRSRTSPFFFLFQISQQIELLETSKILAEMGRSWQADWATAKFFLSNLHRHVMNKCWKFQEVILILVWVIDKRLKICCNQWPPVGQNGAESGF